jgi:hypothetical protein
LLSCPGCMTFLHRSQAAFPSKPASAVGFPSLTRRESWRQAWSSYSSTLCLEGSKVNITRLFVAMQRDSILFYSFQRTHMSLFLTSILLSIALELYATFPF